MNNENNQFEGLSWNKWDNSQDLDPFPDIKYQCPICLQSFQTKYSKCPNCNTKLKE